jgi:hypothetical protein
MKAYWKDVLSDRIGVMFFLAMVLLAGGVLAQDQTGEIKSALANPYVLYALMIAGSVVSLIKQWGAAKMDGATATIGGLLGHWQETLTTLFGNSIAFFLLIDTGTLNFISAVSIGYAINSLADLNPVGTRSTVLAGK